MHPEAAFLAGYAIALVAVAAGLEALGRRSTDPWASRMLAASRPLDVERADERAAWPHSDVPAFHVGLSGAVLAAALLLTAVSIIRHHRPPRARHPARGAGRHLDPGSPRLPAPFPSTSAAGPALAARR